MIKCMMCGSETPNEFNITGICDECFDKMPKDTARGFMKTSEALALLVKLKSKKGRGEQNG